MFRKILKILFFPITLILYLSEIIFVTVVGSLIARNEWLE